MAANTQICFYHIEKCGGTSLRNTLNTWYVAAGYRVEAEHNLTAPEDVAHFVSRDTQVVLCHCSFDHAGVTDHFADSAISIVCLREPLQRMLSHYYFFDYQLNGQKKLHELPMDQLAYTVEQLGKNMLMRLSGNTFSMDQAKRNLSQRISAVLFVESLSDDLVLLRERLFPALPPMPPLGRDNPKRVDYFDWLQQDLSAMQPFHHLIEDLELYHFARTLTLDQRFKHQHQKQQQQA